MKSIVFGVTTPVSLKLLGTIPELMAEHGWDVHVVGALSNSVSSVPGRRLEHHALQMSRKPSLVRDFKALILWIALLNRLQPDIVSAGTPKAALLGMVASFLLRVKVRVYMLRGLRLEGSKGLERNLLFGLEKLCAGLSTHVVAVSPSLREKYISSKLADEEKVILLGQGSSHGVNTSPKIAENLEESVAEIQDIVALHQRKQPVVGFVGRFSQDKGADDLLACKRYLDKKGVAHHFLIVGEVEGSYEVLNEMNLTGEEVLTTGQVENTAGIYSLIDLLLLPTRREGFPNVVLEAAVFGVPCVAYRVTGAMDSVIHGRSGVLVDRDDVLSFVKETARLVLNPSERQRLGYEAGKIARLYFDEDVVARTHLKFYEDCLAK